MDTSSKTENKGIWVSRLCYVGLEIFLLYGGFNTLHFLLISSIFFLYCETDLSKDIYFAIFEHKECQSTSFLCLFSSWWTYQTGADWQNSEPCYVSFHSAKGGRVWKIRKSVESKVWKNLEFPLYKLFGYIPNHTWYKNNQKIFLWSITQLGSRISVVLV